MPEPLSVEGLIELRNVIGSAIFDPGAFVGNKGEDRTLTTWQIDAVMKAIAEAGLTVQAAPSLKGDERVKVLEEALRAIMQQYRHVMGERTPEIADAEAALAHQESRT